MTAQLPDGANTLLNRQQTARSLTLAGYPVSPNTLSTMATRGGGPPFCKWGPRAMYVWGDALAWAKARLTPSRRSTSKADAQHASAA